MSASGERGPSSPRATGPRTTRQRRSHEKQQAMRSAAAKLLIDHGPSAITHRQVATAAGVPMGSASYYFPTRDGLYRAAVEAAEDLRVHAAREYAAALPHRQRTPEATARHLIEGLYAPHLEPDVVVVRLAPMLEATRQDATAATMQATWPAYLRVLRSILEKSGYRNFADEDVLIMRLLVDAGLLYARTAGAEDAVAYAVDRVAGQLKHIGG